MTPPSVTLKIDSFPDDNSLNILMASAWPEAPPTRFRKSLETCLLHITAHHDDRLIGFVKVATDGAVHAFLLDPIVHPNFQHQGIGTRLVKEAMTLARARGAHWLHVDFESHLEAFYFQCGFTKTQAGLYHL